MRFDGQMGNNSQEICNLFANFFQEVYTTFADEDRDRDYFSFAPEFTSDISVYQLSKYEIFNALKNLSATKGPRPAE